MAVTVNWTEHDISPPEAALQSVETTFDMTVMIFKYPSAALNYLAIEGLHLGDTTHYEHPLLT